MQVRELLSLADGLAESPMESATRLVCLDGGLPPPVLQFEVFDDRGWVRYRLDHAWPHHKVGLEYDSEQYHTSPLAVRRGQARHAWLEERGWHILHATADDVLCNPDRLVRRIRLALGRSAAA